MTTTATAPGTILPVNVIPAFGRWEGLQERTNTVGHGIDRDVDHAYDRAHRSLTRLADVLDQHAAKARTGAEKAKVRADIDRLEAELAAKKSLLRPAMAKPATDPAPPDVRGWARANGHTVGVRGRIPESVQAAYDQAHPAQATA